MLEFLPEANNSNTTVTNAKKERYISLKKLGEGSFGQVRQGYDTLLGIDVALKYVSAGKALVVVVNSNNDNNNNNESC